MDIDKFIEQRGLNPLEKLDNDTDGFWYLKDLLEDFVDQQNEKQGEQYPLLSVTPRFSRKALIGRNDPLIKQLQELALRFRDEHEDEEGFQKLDGVMNSLLTLTNEG